MLRMLANCFDILRFNVSVRFPVFSSPRGAVVEPPCSIVRYNGTVVKLSDGIADIGTIEDIDAPVGVEELWLGEITV